MSKRKNILTTLWIIIVLIAIGCITALILLPQWKGMFVAGMGGFLILNLFLSMYFVQKNIRD